MESDDSCLADSNALAMDLWPTSELPSNHDLIICLTWIYSTAVAPSGVSPALQQHSRVQLQT